MSIILNIYSSDDISPASKPINFLTWNNQIKASCCIISDDGKEAFSRKDLLHLDILDPMKFFPLDLIDSNLTSNLQLQAQMLVLELVLLMN